MIQKIPSAFLCLAYSVDLTLAHHVKFDSIILTYFLLFTLDLINLAWYIKTLKLSWLHFF